MNRENNVSDQSTDGPTEAPEPPRRQQPKKQTRSQRKKQTPASKPKAGDTGSEDADPEQGRDSA